jgi:hypothetical protein
MLLKEPTGLLSFALLMQNTSEVLCGARGPFAKENSSAVEILSLTQIPLDVFRTLCLGISCIALR